MKNKTLLKLLLSAIITAGLIYVSRLFAVSPFIIIIGFRFHVCFVVSGLFFINTAIENVFRVETVKWGRLTGLIFMYLVFSAAPFALIPAKLATFHQGDNFYELGVSSVFDFPIYFLWNLPQFIMFYFSLKAIQALKPSAFFIPVFLLIITSTHFAPPVTPFPVWTIGQVLGLILIILLLIYKSANWLEFCVLLFFIIWSTLLIFGTENEMLVKLFLGKNYTAWDGFISSKIFSVEMLRSAYLGMLLVITAFVRRPKKALQLAFYSINRRAGNV